MRRWSRWGMAGLAAAGVMVAGGGPGRAKEIEVPPTLTYRHTLDLMVAFEAQHAGCADFWWRMARCTGDRTGMIDPAARGARDAASDWRMAFINLARRMERVTGAESPPPPAVPVPTARADGCAAAEAAAARNRALCGAPALREGEELLHDAHTFLMPEGPEDGPE